MGFFDRFVGKSRREGRKAREAHERELAGDLKAAVALYLEAELPDDAARVLLLRADAEPSAEKRIAFCAMAAERAESEELRRKARGRKALCAFDTLKKSGGSFLGSEVLAVARELEEAGELERAADAFALAGDGESEVRVLTAAGAIERLEERLRASEGAARKERDLDTRLRRIADLDRTAERRAALRLCEGDRDDARIEAAARGIRARLLRGPVVDLEIDGKSCRYALGDEVTIGRGDSTIVISSRAVSRRHLRLARGPAGVFVEDLDTRNGTMLAGARIAGRLPVGGQVELMLGGEVPCRVQAVADSGLELEIAGTRYFAPLGDLSVGPWRVGVDLAEEPFVLLRTPAGAARPILGDFELAPAVELCHGDEIRSSRGGPVLLRVPAARGGAPADDETDVFHTFNAGYDGAASGPKPRAGRAGP